MRASTYPGMASWAIPDSGRTCRECGNWMFNGHLGDGRLRDAPCRKYQQLMHMGKKTPRVPHYAPACRFFAAVENPPTAYREPGGHAW